MCCCVFFPQLISIFPLIKPTDIAINIFLGHYCLLFCSAMYKVYINDNNFHESMKCASFECEKKTEKGLTYSDPKMITTYNGKTKTYDKHKLLPPSKLMKN